MLLFFFPAWFLRLQCSLSSNRLREFPFLPVWHAVSDPEPKVLHEWKCCLQLKLGVNARGWTIHHAAQDTWRHMNILYINVTYSETSTYAVCTQSTKLWDVFNAKVQRFYDLIKYFTLNYRLPMRILLSLLYLYFHLLQSEKGQRTERSDNVATTDKKKIHN